MIQQRVQPGSPDYPLRLLRAGTGRTPPVISTLGNLALLHQPLTAFFCSSKCPGSVILAAYDKAAKWRDAGRCIVSGFHSPVEKECLQILLRGLQPIVICPARSLENFRVPPDWKAAFVQGRCLILSFFDAGHRRVTAELAARRNDFVAALAEEICFAHVAPGGEMQRLQQKLMSGAESNRVSVVS